MSTLNKLSLLNALIASKREIAIGCDKRLANQAKGTLIGLYRAKRWLEQAVELEDQRMNIFKRAG